MLQGISNLDFGIIILYFIVVFAVAFWVTFRERKNKGSEEYGSADFFLGGRNLGWFVIGASLFASNIGSEHLVGLAGSGARGDMPTAQFEVLASLILIVLGWVFVPFYIRSGIFTLPEFLERRYSGSARTYLSILSIFSYVLTKISITIFAGALVFEVMGVPFWTGALIVVVATGVYTIFGGLRAVLFTDMIQMFVLVGGALAVTFFGLQALGGWGGMMDTLGEAAAATENVSGKGHFFNLWRPMSDPDFPWTGILFGAPILGLWYWCTDQFIVQRVLSAKDESNARRGALFGGFLKLLPLFIFVIPGVIAYALAQKGILNNMNDPDQALPAMIQGFLPSGIKGLVLAGLLAALMSSLSSVFNSSSTLFTIDFYKRYRPNTSERQLVYVGQIATVVLVGLSLLWIPLMRVLMEGGGIYKYLQSIQAYISPPIAAAFLLGLFFPRLNARGAMLSLWSGFVLGISRLFFEALTSEGYVTVSPGTFLDFWVNTNFLHFAILLFVVSALVLVLGSLSAPPKPAAELENLVYVKGTRPVYKRMDVWFTIALIGAVLVVWLVFSPLGIGG